MRTERHYLAARARCLRNLQIPEPVRDWDYKVSTLRTGEEVLEHAGVTLADTLADPTILLRTNSVYGGGSSICIDPFHPAARALIALRLAAGTWDEDTLETAIAMASDALAEHGAPPEIDDVYAIGDRARHFAVEDTIGALYVPPTELPQQRSLWARICRRERPAVPAAHWATRSDAAYTMIGARVAMPAHHHARAVVTAYTDVLTNPKVPAGLVVERGIEVGQILTGEL